MLKRGVIFLVILLALVALFFAFFPRSEEVKSGSLDELVELTVKGSVELADGTVEGNIDRIVQEGDTLTAMEGDTQIFKSSFVGSTAELYDYLVAREVDMSKVALNPQPPSGFNWGNLLLTLLPLILFVVVLWFIFRRIKRTNPIQEKIETIKKLAELKEAGIITEEEFEAKKSALLDQL